MRTCVIILNWNGWTDTIECLESLFRLRSKDVGVVVCDNGSSDESLQRIKAWAQGEIESVSENPQLSSLTIPAVPKPIPYIELTREQAESGDAKGHESLTLIQNGTNLGFAAGNNVGLRYALSISDYRYFWLLNNDTVVEPTALETLVREMHEHPEVGLCGSLNLSYHHPEDIQALGGKTYNRWTSRVNKLPKLTRRELGSPAPAMDFVNGAATMVSRTFLEEIGLMDESYFLYFEELDWAMRARGKFVLGFASESVIYHKEGASIGSHPDRLKRSLVSDKYLSRNRVLFTKRFFPWALPSVLASVSLAAAERLWHGDRERALAMVSFMLQGLTMRTSGKKRA
jgi:GT2 family glycosyltransferase